MTSNSQSADSSRQIYLLSRVTIAVIFVYHGLVPKLLFSNYQEVMMNDELIPFMSEEAALYISGIAELVYAVALLVFFRSKYLLYPAMGFSVLATLALIVTLPNLFENAFNPFSINLALLVLCMINIKSGMTDRDGGKEI